MKPKYYIGEIVKVKATGEKVSIVDVDSRIYVVLYGVHELSGLFSAYFEESELKPYRPSRTGKYRNEKGQFVSKEYIDYLKMLDNQLKFERNPDSKQRNYQKILSKLDVLEKKIDELGSKI